MSVPNEDTGQTPDQVRVARELWRQHENAITRAGLISAIAATRLLVPLVSKEIDDLTEMVQVTFHSNDGRKACLAFTSIEELHQFNSQARPFVKQSSTLAREVLEQNLDGIIIDISSDHRIALTLSEIASLAQG